MDLPVAWKNWGSKSLILLPVSCNVKTFELLTAAGTLRMGTLVQVTMPRSPAGFEHVQRAWKRHGGWPVSTWSCGEIIMFILTGKHFTVVRTTVHITMVIVIEWVSAVNVCYIGRNKKVTHNYFRIWKYSWYWTCC